MLSDALLLLFGCLVAVRAQQEVVVVEDIVNDVVTPNDGLFSNVVEQFGIVSFSPTPSVTASVTPSVSSSAEVSPTASVFASPVPLASNSPLPFQGSSPMASPSTSPSSSVSPVPSARGRRGSSPNAPQPPAASATPSSTPSTSPSLSPSPDPCGLTITLPASGYETLAFEFADRNREDSIDFDLSAEFGGDQVGLACQETEKGDYTFVDETDNRETVEVAIEKALNAGLLDSPQELVLKAGWYKAPTNNEDAEIKKVISSGVYIYNGSIDEDNQTSIQQLPFLRCCAAVRARELNSCASDPVATVRISKNADDTITLSAAYDNPLVC